MNEINNNGTESDPEQHHECWSWGTDNCWMTNQGMAWTPLGGNIRQTIQAIRPQTDCK